jgi:TnpA family transposase
MQILSPAEYADFDAPPAFTGAEREKFFDLPQSLDSFFASLRTPVSRIGFLLMFGYFKAAKRFFERRFHEADIAYVVARLGLPPEVFEQTAFDHATVTRYRRLILDYFGFQEFNEHARQAVSKEIRAMARSQVRPKAIFLQVLDILVSCKTEIPNAYILTDLIVGEIRRHKRTLTDAIHARIPPATRKLLDGLLEKCASEEEPAPQIERFKLTLLKRISQSTKPLKIKATLDDWQTLRTLYQELDPIVAALDLTQEGIRYHATSVMKSQVFQISRRAEDDRHLHLICFIAHQFYRLQDTLIDVLLTVTQATQNVCKRICKDKHYAARKDQSNTIQAFINCVDQGAVSPLSAIELIAFSPDLSDMEKILRIQEILSNGGVQRSTVQQQIEHFKAQAQSAADDVDYYDVLAEQLRKLQNRVAGIVKSIAFEGDKASELMIAIQHYKANEGRITQTAPLEFLALQEQRAVIDPSGAIRAPLYKAILFLHLAEALKAGAINVAHSYKYRPLDDYLISKSEWETHRDDYLQRADLTAVADCQRTLDALATQLDQQYHETNQRILAGENPYIHFRKDGSFYVTTPKVEPEDSEPMLSIFPKHRYISLLEVLATVNRFTHFVDSFDHWQIKYNRAKPADRTFFAGIMGYGCFIGTSKMADISNGITASELDNTVNWYFSLDNVHNANDRILQFMDRLALPEIYRQADGLLHTSSDGAKFEVAVDSLHAAYSFKYFGQEKGVNACTFIDMRHFLYHSLIISAVEKEAAFVIDGLMHNDVVNSDIHSTDTGGYNEVLFGIMHLLGFSFAPRIKNFGRQHLYAFQKRKLYEQQGYKILPYGYINIALVLEQWDEILRFVATIKLKETTASQLFKRLNSYSKQHPLYCALKEFGKIFKSIFLLRYTDILTMRQAVEKQLNKGESAQKFTRAISFGNNQEFLYGEKMEQEIAEACRRLIKNAIICWNYLYLTQKIAEAESEEYRQALLTAVRNSSVITWHHFNLHGEYDFSEARLQDSVGLNADIILAMKRLDPRL